MIYILSYIIISYLLVGLLIYFNDKKNKNIFNDKLIFIFSPITILIIIYFAIFYNKNQNENNK